MMWQHASNPESASGRHVFLGTYPPRQCGIATFTKDLIDAFDGATGGFSDVIAVDDASGRRYPYSGRVVRKLAQNERSSYRQTARYIDASEYQTLNIQHEFGIFGGADGRWLLDLMDETRKPVVLTMHTVLPSPSPAHKALVSRLCALAARTVVLSRTAKRLLVSRYGVDPDAVRTIPHGIPDVRFAPTAEFKRSLGFEHRFVVSTFGLLSRGKGLETAIDAIAQAVRSVPNIVYLILGATHPVVARDEGESYREELQARIQSSGIDRNVRMVDRYLNVPELLLYLSSTDAYVTPYVNPDQIVSGTLAYAAGSGRAIVSTPYLYARELLSGERGIIVPFGDSASMAGGDYETCFRRCVATRHCQACVRSRARDDMAGRRGGIRARRGRRPFARIRVYPPGRLTFDERTGGACGAVQHAHSRGPISAGFFDGDDPVGAAGRPFRSTPPQ